MCQICISFYGRGWSGWNLFENTLGKGGHATSAPSRCTSEKMSRLRRKGLGRGLDRKVRLGLHFDPSRCPRALASSFPDHILGLHRNTFAWFIVEEKNQLVFMITSPLCSHLICLFALFLFWACKSAKGVRWKKLEDALPVLYLLFKDIL